MSSIDAGSFRERRPRAAAARPVARRSARATGTTRRIAPTTAALMALCALLLVGVVFVQIAVIRQNMDRSDLETRSGNVSAQNRDLETQIQHAESSPQIAVRAEKLGMVFAPAALAHPLTGHPLNGG
jgi:cell division protein FtsL